MWFFTLIYVAIVGLVNNAGLCLSGRAGRAPRGETTG